MTKDEERIYTHLLANRHHRAENVADALNLPIYTVQDVMDNIGTPEEIWRNGGGIAVGPTRGALLDTAKKLTCGDRNSTYGPPVENMQHIADIFNAWTGMKLTARHVAQIHIATKMARRTTSPTHIDSYVDDMAYTGIEYECAKAAERKG